MTGRVYKADAATGGSLRAVRRELGLSRRQVALRANTTPRFLSEVERGKRGAPPSYYARVAAACVSFVTGQTSGRRRRNRRHAHAARGRVMAIAVTSTVGKVGLSGSSPAADLAPDEARRLAVSLIEHAARAEETTEADTWF